MLTPRFRTTPAPRGTVVYPTGQTVHDNNQFWSVILDYQGGQIGQEKNVEHIQLLKQATGMATWYSSGPYYGQKFPITNIGSVYSFPQGLVDQAIAKIDIASFDFQKNNDFELITFITDIDGKLGKFLVDMFRPNHGNLRWGILPFLSDLRSLTESYGDFLFRIADELKGGSGFSRTFKVKEQYKLPINHPTHPQLITAEVEGVLRFRGGTSFKPDFRPLQALYVLLDELGVHPDLRTVWDTLPLSFVVDYFFPIGDLLEKAHPRTWFNPEVTFDGRVSFNGTWFTLVQPPDPTLAVEGTAYLRYLERYEAQRRRFLGKDIEATFPTIIQWWNIMYLAATGRGGQYVRSFGKKKPGKGSEGRKALAALEAFFLLPNLLDPKVRSDFGLPF